MLAVNPETGYLYPMTAIPPDMKIRISAGLRRQIEDAAKRNNRTMNGEIIARLEKSFEPKSGREARDSVTARGISDDELDDRIKKAFESATIEDKNGKKHLLLDVISDMHDWMGRQ